MLCLGQLGRRAEPRQVLPFTPRAGHLDLDRLLAIGPFVPRVPYDDRVDGRQHPTHHPKHLDVALRRAVDPFTPRAHLPLPHLLDHIRIRQAREARVHEWILPVLVPL